MTRRLKHLNRALELPCAPPPFELEAKQVCRPVHDILVTEQRERKLYMKQKIKFAAVLVAAVVALTGTALAVGPTVQELINQALGNFAPYAQEITGVSAVDQGIEIKAVTAVSDRRNVKIILEIQDLKGSRITGDDLVLSIGKIERDRAAGEYEGAAYGFGLQCIGYDEERRTALYELHLVDMDPLYFVNAPVTINILGVNPEVRDFECWPELPTEGLSETRLPSKTLSTGETVLAPEQNSAEFEGTQGVALSSMGFASDGLFHLQLKMPKGVIKESDRVDAFIWKETGNPEQSRQYYGDHTDVYFQDGAAYYKDMTYPIAVAEFQEIHIGELNGSYRTAPKIEGKWNLTVPLEELPERTIMVNQALGGLMINTVSISDLSANANAKPIPGEKVHYRIPGLQLTVYMKDGTVVIPETRNNWDFGSSIDPTDVTAIAIGMWYMPLQGDTALPGYWLAELPQ